MLRLLLKRRVLYKDKQNMRLTHSGKKESIQSSKQPKVTYGKLHKTEIIHRKCNKHNGQVDN